MFMRLQKLCHKQQNEAALSVQLSAFCHQEQRLVSSAIILENLTMNLSGFGGLGVSALAFGTHVRGFKPGRSRRIFEGEKILSAPSFGREVKPWVPCR
jgi:hypothetical protein